MDLAGSENARLTGAMGDRLAEAGNINKSLLTLSRVISQLAKVKGKAKFINWRDSKLTQILQPSLAGNCRTAVICCVTPASQFVEETKSTLSFASRAKQIRTHAVVNEVLSGEGEIQKLKSTVRNLQQELEKNTVALEEKKLLEEKISNLTALLISGGKRPCETESLTPRQQRKRRKKKHRETWCPGQVKALRSASKKMFDLPNVNTENQPRSENSKLAADLPLRMASQTECRAGPSGNPSEAIPLNGRIAELEDSIESERNAMKKAASEVEKLKHANAMMGEELVIVKEQYHDAQVKLKQQAEDEASLLQTISEAQSALVARVEMSTVEAQQVREQMHQLSAKLNREEIKSESLSRKLEDIDNSAQLAVTKLPEIEETVLSLEAERAETQSILEQKHKEIRQLNAQVEQLQEEKIKLEDLVQTKTNEVDLAGAELEKQLFEERANLKDLCKRLEDELTTARRSAESSEASLLEAMTSVQVLGETEKQLKLDLKCANELNDKLQKEKTSWEQSISNLQAEYDGLKTQSCKLGGEMSRFTEGLKSIYSNNATAFEWCGLSCEAFDLHSVSTALSRMYTAINDEKVKCEVRQVIQTMCRKMECENVEAEFSRFDSTFSSVSKETSSANETAIQESIRIIRQLKEGLGIDIAHDDDMGGLAVKRALDDLVRERNCLATELETLKRQSTVESRLSAENMQAHYENQLEEAHTQIVQWKAKAVESTSVLEGSNENVQSQLRISEKRVKQLELSLELSKQETEKGKRAIEQLSDELKTMSHTAVTSEQELTRRIASLSEANAALSKENQALGAESTSLKSRVDTAMANTSRLEAALRESQNSNACNGRDDRLELQKELEQARFKEESMLVSIKALEKKNLMQAERIEECTNHIARLEEDQPAKELPDGPKDIDIGALKTQNEDLIQEVQARKAEVSSLQSRLKRSSDESKRLMLELESSSARLDQHTSKIEEDAEELVSLKSRVNEIESALKEQNEENAALATERNEVAVTIAEYSVGQALDDSSGKPRDDDSLLQQVKSCFGKMRRELEDRKAVVEELGRKVKLQTEELSSLNASASKNAEVELRKEIERLGKTLQLALRDKKRVEEECGTLRLHMEEASKLADVRLARISKLEKTKLSEAQCAKIMETKKAFKELKVKYAEVVSTNKRLSENFEVLKGHASKNKATLDKVVKETTMKFGILDYIEPENLIPMITEKLEILQAERDALESELRANESDQKLEVLYKQKAMTEEKLAQIHNRLQEEIRKNIKLTNELNASKAQYSSQSSQMKSKAQDLVRQNEDVIKQIDSTKQELLACQAELANAEAKCNDLQEEKAKSTQLVQTKFAQYEQGIEKLKQEVQSLNESLLNKSDEHKQSVRFLEKENLELMVELRKLREERRVAKSSGTPDTDITSHPLREINGNSVRKARAKSNTSTSTGAENNDTKQPPAHLELGREDEGSTECKQQ